MLVSEETNDQNIFEEERYDIFGNVYLANTQNRLRELDNPNDVDCKRWPWELVQNAKDSISGQQNRNGVDIEITASNNTYTIKHNGSPFNIKSLTALMYKYSSGKNNDSESTGRFGTGFLTTHTLSKIVEIKGDIILKNKSNPQGFSLTMYREGEGEELLKGLKKTEKSFKTYKNPFGWTSYKYIAYTKRNKDAGRMGIQNFKENIAKVMLFCPEINSIKLNDNGKELTIKRGNEINNNNGCKKLTLHINNNGKTSIKTFLYLKINEYNKELSEKFGTRRNHRICCAVELDENNNIFVDTSSPCLFCSLPLVGSEVHELPFIINSPDFEPDSERQAILLDGDKIDEKTKKISVPGINKMILERSHSMYRTLLECICQNNIGNRYLLARGLRSTPDVTRFFDRQWYYDNFICPMRNILLEFPIVWNGTRYYKLTEVYLPEYNNYGSAYRKELYNFISQLYKSVPTFDDSLLIEKTIWKNDNRLRYININQCIEKIQNLGNISKLDSIIDEEVWTWLDSFLLLIKNYHSNYLNNYSIIPNMNSNFINQTNELATSKYVPENMIDCLENLEIKWRNNHIHKNIEYFTTGTDHDIDFAVSKIRICLKRNTDKKLILMHYIPYDCKDEYFIEKRELLYEFCKTLWSEKMSQKKDGSQFPKELWNDIDDEIFEKLLESIENYGQLNNIITTEFLNKFLKCVSNYYYYYTSYSIIPNKNGKFCRKDALSKDDNIPSIFKQCLKYCFNYDIDNELIHDDIITSNIHIGKKRIYNYYTILNKYFEMPENYYYRQSNYMPLEKKKQAAEYLIRIIPEFNNKITSDNDPQNKQRNLYELYKKFTKRNYDVNVINRNDNNEKIWEKSNKYIIDMIKEKIENYSNISNLAKYLDTSNKKTIEYIKKFILFSTEGKIIPNQNGNLCMKDSLYNEGEEEEEKEKEKENIYIKLIPEKLKIIAEMLDYNIKDILIHKDMGRICSSYISYDMVCREIDTRIIKYYNNKSNNENLKITSHYIIEEYFDEIGDEEADLYFHKIYSKKDDITLNVIYDKKTRENMTALGKQYGEGSIPELLKNKEIVKGIINGELTNEKYNNMKKLEKDYSEKDMEYILTQPKLIKELINDSLILNNNSESVRVSFNTEIVSEQKQFLSNAFRLVMEYGDDFDFDNSINKRTGMCGEAYIYELLKQSGEFKKVHWNMLNENGYGQLLEYQGEEYYVNPDGSHYDILCETKDGRKIYIEVKSTQAAFGNKVPFYISKKQIEMMKQIKPPNEYVLAVVFNVMNYPDHFFMTLKSDIANKYICY